MKKIIWFIAFVYILNIIAYFGVVRSMVVGGIDKMMNDPSTVKRLEDKGVVLSQLKKSALMVDVQIFNPIFNISYSIASVKMILVNLVLAFFLTYWLTNRKSSVEPSLSENSNGES